MSTLFWSLVRALRFALSHRHACSMFSAGTLTITSRPTAKTARALHSSTTAANPNSNLRLHFWGGFAVQGLRKGYICNETHLELTVVSETREYGEQRPAATQLFRTRLVSYLYERGWRQAFVLGGFPGPEKEFEMSKEYFEPVLGGNIVDASCGSGMFSRLFAKSGLFSHVIALDFSANMLKECYQFVQKEDNFLKE